MGSSQSREEAFAEARKKKRQIFQTLWNDFLKRPALSSVLILYALSQMMFFLLSGLFVRDFAFAMDILQEDHPFWCDLVILALQILISLPGAVSCIGLFLLKGNGFWTETSPPDMRGYMLLKRSNSAISVLGGIALALYPTVIIATGEYLTEEAVSAVFSLFLAITALLVTSLTLIRPVLRRLEENIACCWADGKLLAPLLLALPLTAAVILVCIPLKALFCLTVIMLALSLELLLLLYWRFLKAASGAQEEIDRQVLSVRENPDDPYNRY